MTTATYKSEDAAYNNYKASQERQEVAFQHKLIQDK